MLFGRLHELQLKVKSFSHKSKRPTKSLEHIASLQDAPMFTLGDVPRLAKVIEVYDGDTVTAAVELDKDTFRSFKVRLAGLDAPEMRPPLNAPNRSELLKAAESAKDYLQTLLLNRLVHIQFLGTEKYGRQLARIYLEDPAAGKMSVNDMLLTGGFAKPYDGGSKTTA